MTPGRTTLLAFACVASGGLIASYAAEVAAGYDLVPLPVSMFLWLCSILSWQGFIVAHVCAVILGRVDSRMDQILASINSHDDDADRKTIDQHLATIHAVGRATPSQRRPRPHPVRLTDR